VLIIIDVIIPAYNEESSILKVIADIPKSVREVIVVDNNSDDKTSELAIGAGATVVYEPQKGYGKACLAGISYMNSGKIRPDVVVFLDADYSDYPEELPSLVGPIQTDKCDMVIGSRALGRKEKGALLPHQMFGNWIATKMMSIMYNSNFTDLGPFRAIKYDRLMDIKMIDEDYGWTVEMQVKALKHGLKCAEVPVKYRKRIGTSKITGTVAGTFGAGYKIIKTILKYR